MERVQSEGVRNRQENLSDLQCPRQVSELRKIVEIAMDGLIVAAVLMGFLGLTVLALIWEDV